MSAAKSGPDLKALREIGWRLWNPIGLNPDSEDLPFIVDEYDGYLLRVAACLRNGDATEDCVAYLLEIESSRMGLGLPDETASRQRAKQTVAAISALIDERT